jgi:hypothetical protein
MSLWSARTVISLWELGWALHRVHHVCFTQGPLLWVQPCATLADYASVTRTFLTHGTPNFNNAPEVTQHFALRKWLTNNTWPQKKIVALSRAKLHPLHILSRYTSLSLFYLNHPPTAIGRFPAYRLSPRLATPSLDTYINLDPFVLGLLIPDDWGSTHLWNVGRQSFYTAV